MRTLRALAAMLITASLLLSGCGGDDEPAATDESGQSEAPSEDVAVDPGDEPASSTDLDFGDCSAITADEMAPLLGAGVGSAEVPPGGGGCDYRLDDPQLPTANLSQASVSDYADGFEGAKTNVMNVVGAGTIDGEVQDVPGVGDGAVVIAGASDLGTMGVGLVLLGDTIVRVWVIPGSDLPADGINAITTAVLGLVASKA